MCSYCVRSELAEKTMEVVEHTYNHQQNTHEARSNQHEVYRVRQAAEAQCDDAIRLVDDASELLPKQVIFDLPSTSASSIWTKHWCAGAALACADEVRGALASCSVYMNMCHTDNKSFAYHFDDYLQCIHMRRSCLRRILSMLCCRIFTHQCAIARSYSRVPPRAITMW